MGPTTNPLDATERREDLRTDEEKDEVLAWVRPRSISFSPYFTPYANVRIPQARRYVASHPYRGPPPPRSEHESSHPTRQPAQQRELLSNNVNDMIGLTTEPGFFIGGPEDLCMNEEKAEARLAWVRPCPMSLLIIILLLNHARVQSRRYLSRRPYTLPRPAHVRVAYDV